jgi:hypothetical protein
MVYFIQTIQHEAGQPDLMLAAPLCIDKSIHPTRSTGLLVAQTAIRIGMEQDYKSAITTLKDPRTALDRG